MSPTAIRLSVMMFFQFFMWGAWYVTGPSFLGKIGFTAADFGWTFSVGPIAGIISPFFVGMIADRFFSTQKVLGSMHIVGGALMLWATTLMDPGSPASPAFINFVLFLHMLCYYPTLALTNSLAMHNMKDSEKEFPIVRVFGTIGWILAGFTLSWLSWGADLNMFRLCAFSAIGLGAYCFTLPDTPPGMAGRKLTIRELLGLDAFVLLKQRPFLIFMISSFLICIPLAFYYQMAERAVKAAGVGDTPTKMAFGQISEIVFMLLMPLFFKRLGVKWMLFVGMGAWVLRYALFAIGAPDAVHWMMISGIVLHGICYDFFFVTGQIYTDQVAPEGIRSQAQGMLVLFTLGLGMLIGAQIAGQVEASNTPETTVQMNKEVKAIGEEIAELKKADTIDEAKIDALQKDSDAKTLEGLKAMNWKQIWMIPAIAAGVIMLLFAGLFTDPPKSDEPAGDVEPTPASA